LMMGENGWNIVPADGIRPGFEKSPDSGLFSVGVLIHGFASLATRGRTTDLQSDMEGAPRSRDAHYPAGTQLSNWLQFAAYGGGKNGAGESLWQTGALCADVDNRQGVKPSGWSILHGVLAPSCRFGKADVRPKHFVSASQSINSRQ